MSTNICVIKKKIIKKQSKNGTIFVLNVKNVYKTVYFVGRQACVTQGAKNKTASLNWLKGKRR